MSVIILILVVAVCANAAVTTHGPTTTHPPITTPEQRESDYINFSYNANSHHMYTRIDNRTGQWVDRLCYIAQLSQQEQSAVHTDIGMRALELKMLAKLSSAVEIAFVDISQVDKNKCPHPTNGTLRVFSMTL